MPTLTTTIEAAQVKNVALQRITTLLLEKDRLLLSDESKGGFYQIDPNTPSSSTLRALSGGSGKQTKYEVGAMAPLPGGGMAVASAADDEVLLLDGSGVIVRSFGSSGKEEGELDEPSGLAVSGRDRIYVAERGNNRVSAFTREGFYLFAFGNDLDKNRNLSNPSDVAIDARERIYVLDSGRGSRLSIFGPHGELLRQIESSELKDIFGGVPQLVAMTATAAGQVVLADQRSGLVVMIDPQRLAPLFSFGSNGAGRGQYRNVRSLAFDGEHVLAIGDRGNRKIELFEVPVGSYREEAGAPYLSTVRIPQVATAPCPVGRPFPNDSFLCVGAKSGNAFVMSGPGQIVLNLSYKFNAPIDAVYDDELIVVLDRDDLKVFDRKGNYRFSIGRSGSRAGEFSRPQGLALTPTAIYVADSGNGRVQIFSRNGVFQRQLVTNKDGKEEKELPQLREPTSLAVDRQGRVYVGDSSEHCVFLFGANGNLIARLGGGEDTPGYFESVHDIAIGADGYAYLLVETPGNPNAILLYDGSKQLFRVGDAVLSRRFEQKDDLRLSSLPGAAPALLLSDPESGQFVRIDVLHVPDRLDSVAIQGGRETIDLKWGGTRLPQQATFRIYGAPEQGGNYRLLMQSAQNRVELKRFQWPNERWFMVSVVSAFGLEGPKTEAVEDTFFAAYLRYRTQDFEGANKMFRSVLADNPNHAPALEYLGRGLIKLGRVDEAMSIFERLQSVPGHQAAAFNLQVEALLQRQSWLDAKRVADKAIAASVADAETYSLCARTRVSMNDVVGAIGCMEKAAALEPSRSKWHLELARLYGLLGTPDKSQQEMTNAYQLAGDDPIDWLDLAKAYRAVKDEVNALGCYRRVLQLDPDNVTAMLEVTKAQLAEGKIDDVRQLALKLGEDERKGGIANFLLGEVALAEGRTQESLLYLAKAGESEVTGVAVWLAMADAYKAANDATGRMRALKRAVEFDETNIALRKDLAAACEKVGDFACMVEHLGFAVAIVPTDPDIRMGLAAGQVKSGNFVAALEQAKAVVAMQPRNIEALKLQAEAERQVGKVADSLHTLELAKSISGNDQSIFLMLAKSYMDNRLFEQAQKQAEEAIALDPAQAAPYVTLGEIFLARQMFDRAIEAFTEATKRDSRPEYQQRLNYTFIQKKNAEQNGSAASGLALEGFVPKQIFAATYKRYAGSPVATVQLRNLSGVSYVNVKLSFHIKNYMDFPTTREIAEVKPGESLEIPLVASFNNNILNIDEDTAVQSEIKANYFSLGKPVVAELTQPMTIYGKNAMLWSDSEMVGAFVTPKDDALSVFTRQVINRLQPEVGPLNANLVKAMTIFQSLSANGVRYQIDPNNPYSKLSSTQVDTVQFPRETLRLRSGDCDDLSVLFAAALENLGIETALLDVPGHLFMMFDTGLSSAEGERLSLNQRMLVIRDDRIWIPIEATLVAATFSEAWVEGARKYHSNFEAGSLKPIMLHFAWQKFLPVTMPPANFELPPPDVDKVRPVIHKEWTILARKALERLSAPYQLVLQADPKSFSARMQIAIIYARNGLLDEAEQEMRPLENSTNKGEFYNNLANVYFVGGRYDEAIAKYLMAVKAEAGVADYRVNLAMAYYKQGDIQKATDAFEQARGVDSSVGDRYGHFAALISR